MELALGVRPVHKSKAFRRHPDTGVKTRQKKNEAVARNNMEYMLAPAYGLEALDAIDRCGVPANRRFKCCNERVGRTALDVDRQRLSRRSLLRPSAADSICLTTASTSPWRAAKAGDRSTMWLSAGPIYR